MVDRLEKPDLGALYSVKAAAKAGDDEDKHQQQQQDQGDEYSGSHAMPGWQRIYAAGANRRYMKVSTADVTHVWLRNLIMQRGIGLLEADIALKNGQVIRAAHFILPDREKFWRLKNYRPGQEVALMTITSEPEIEISVALARQQGQDKGPSEQHNEHHEKKRFFDLNNNRQLIAIAAGAVIVIAVILLALL